MADKLKPCPFCAGEPWRAGYTVQCDNCGATVTGANQDAADDLWNKRASPERSE